MLVVQDGRTEPCCAVGHRVFGASLSCEGDISALACLLLDFSLVEAVLFGELFCQVVDTGAGNHGRLPSGNLREAVLADDMGMDRFRANAGGLRDL